MAFGPIMRLKTKVGLSIELAPFSRDDVVKFADGLQHSSITQYLSSDTAQTAETEQAWYDKILQDKQSRIWGIWAIENNERRLIGNTVIEKFENIVMPRAVTGIVITDRNYWGKGIASATHRARTLYAFERMKVVRLMSYVYEGNEPSLQALQRVGYCLHHQTRNELYNKGKWFSVDVMECVNPLDWAWKLWWGNDRPPVKNLAARKRTEEALAWAREHVELV